MTALRLTPSSRMRALVAAMGGVWRASQAWQIEYRSLRRFLEGTGSLEGNTLATILARTRLPYDYLFAADGKKGKKR